MKYFIYIQIYIKIIYIIEIINEFILHHGEN